MIKNNLSVKFKTWFFHKYFDNGTLKVESFEERVIRSNKLSRRPSKKILLIPVIVMALTLVMLLTVSNSDSSTSLVRVASILTLACSLLTAHDSILNFLASNIFKTVNSFHSFKSPTWTLRDVDNIFSKRGWMKVKRELSSKEFETFEVVIQSFDGPIEDLIIAVKEIEKV